jgi:hypothetical protein
LNIKKEAEKRKFREKEVGENEKANTNFSITVPLDATLCQHYSY